MAEPMKMRASISGDVADVKVLMNHPMETGLRKDAKTGQLIPAHFINEVTATLNGKPVLAAQWGGGISKNPYLGFKVKGAKAGDKVTVSWKDNKGESNTAEAAVS
ncbi:MAG: thiosulfate oxidation carrier complex protein SoxZ [Pseudomonadota bacterium]|jgi:sulfur-oxidizing protein SoxZ|uniref:thiosulfate oxidation carrier complex protein SoxZ n=1 Tax=Sulfuriferula sp. TaxID=2025307 RepID=UPI002731C75B|nr:thiosulfate oxidation carrier complex protein SoxZ [Sulfuriferula sp.]MDP2027645.1 thiosulfate oxidation carrier complex protein SoxZ [Sulfuriferula sp.]